jgi:hypothetical protein
MREFHTSNIDLAAYIRCQGIRYIRIETSADNSNIADFVFEECPELFEALVSWHNEDELQDFARKRRKLYVLARRCVEGAITA